jgi:hypothetical protein
VDQSKSGSTKEADVDLTKLTLESVKDLDMGTVAVAFQRHLERAVQDCLDRPGDLRLRPVHLPQAQPSSAARRMLYGNLHPGLLVVLRHDGGDHAKGGPGAEAERVSASV